MDKYIETFSNVSPVAVGLSALAMMIVGTLWYSPFMFGKSWARLSDRPISGAQSNVGAGFFFAAIASLITAYLLGVVATHAVAHWSAMAASIVFIWLFIMLEQLNGVIWERVPFALFLIQTFRSLFALIAAGAVHYLWSML